MSQTSTETPKQSEIEPNQTLTSKTENLRLILFFVVAVEISTMQFVFVFLCLFVLFFIEYLIKSTNLDEMKTGNL